MKRNCLGIFLSLLMALTAWAQGSNAPFDMAKTQKELEIMRGIFKTTLSFNSGDSQRDRFFDLADIRFLYLTDQGVNFYVQNPGFSFSGIALDNFEIEFDEAALKANLEMMGKNLKTVQEKLKSREKSLGELYAARKESQNSTDDQDERARQEYEKFIEAYPSVEATPEEKQKIQAQKQKMEAQQENRRQKLAEVKEALIEAVANYGDSLTTVKNDEYINLIFDTSGQYDLVSIQKSWIKDYKAGKLTLDQFKAKAIQYSMKGR